MGNQVAGRESSESAADMALIGSTRRLKGAHVDLGAKQRSLERKTVIATKRDDLQQNLQRPAMIFDCPF